MAGLETPTPPEVNTSWALTPAITEEHPEQRTSFKIELSAGQSYNDAVSVKNLGARDLTIELYAGDGLTTDTGDFDVTNTETPATNTGSWISLAQTQITVPAGQNLDVPFTLQIPENTTPGDHPGGIVAVVSTQNNGDSNDTVISYNRVGARVHLRVSGEIQPRLSIENLTTSYETSWNPFSGGKATIDYTIKNTGNIRLGYETTAILKALNITQGTPERIVHRELLPGESITERITINKVMPLFWVSTNLNTKPQAITGEIPDTQLTAVKASSGTLALPIPQILLLALSILLVALWLRGRTRYRKLKAQLQAQLQKPQIEAAE